MVGDAATLAVTGSTGDLGGRVARRLAERGVAQRLIVRAPARAPVLDDAELALAPSYGASEEMRRALAGARTLFLVSGREAPERVGEHGIAIDAAKEAGVERIVYVSTADAAADAGACLDRDSRATEEAIRASGLAATILRPAPGLDLVEAAVEALTAEPAGEVATAG
ncbi:MAG: NAD(P)H-binding protein [Solirubrobacterales bacterium]